MTAPKDKSGKGHAKSASPNKNASDEFWQNYEPHLLSMTAYPRDRRTERTRKDEAKPV
jgi:hypothetical protein